MASVKQILIVDDDKDDTDFYAATVQQLRSSYLVKCIHDVRKALEWLMHTHVAPSLIISDVNMPYMNGFEFRKAILANQTLKQLAMPFVFLTTASTRINEFIAEQLSVVGIYEKPSSLQQMTNVFESILARTGL